MALDTLVINFAYAAFFASTFTRSMPRLRGLWILGGLCFIAFGVIVGNWSMVGWNVLTCVLNGKALATRSAGVERADESLDVVGRALGVEVRV